MKHPKATVKRRGGIGGPLPGETIVEITFPDGRGFLLSLRMGSDGVPTAGVYRADPGIYISGPGGETIYTN